MESELLKHWDLLKMETWIKILILLGSVSLGMLINWDDDFLIGMVAYKPEALIW
jgi:hypothetical protein